MTDSPEQTAFYEALLHTQDNILLEATAGSGKTTTIVKGCRIVPQPARVVFLAFNRNIADELQTKMPYFAIAETFHSFCYGMIKRVMGKMEKPDGRKCAGILKKLVPNWKDRKDWEDDFLTLCSRAKAFACLSSIPDYQAPPLSEIRDRFGLEVARLDLVEEVLAASLEDRLKLDFDDMLLHALVFDIPFDSMNYLFVDEAQDTNVVQAMLLAKMIKPGTRLVAVGDPHQAIYGFRGANADALGELALRFNMIKMPLSVTYRCSQAVVEEARKWERLGLGSKVNWDPKPEGRESGEEELEREEW